jgi:hypothetical protein
MTGGRAFIAQAPICLVAIILVVFLLDVPHQGRGDWRSKLRRIDFLGALILVAAVSGLLLGLDRGSNVAWNIPITYVSLTVSAVSFILFILVEIYIASEPFAPGHIIFDRSLVACYACNFFSFGGWLAGLYYLPLRFQAVNGVSATVAGLQLVPCIVCGVSGSLAAGFFMRWTGKYYLITVLGYSLVTVGITVIFLFSGAITDSVPLIILGTVMCAFGNGVGVTTTLIGLSESEAPITKSAADRMMSVVSNAAPEDQAVVTACSYLFRSLGSVIGLSLSAAFVQQLLRDRLRSELQHTGDIDRIVQGVRQSLDFIKTLPPQVRDIVRHCYGWSTNLGFAFQIGIVFFALLSSFFIREQKLSR